MSDENVPKLRLKPKLGTEPAVVPQAEAAPVEPVPSPSPAAESEAPKLVRLKPKLTPAPVQEAAAPVVQAAPVVETPPQVEPAPAPAPEPVRLKPKLSAAPMEKTATQPPMAQPVPAAAPEATPAPAPAPAPAPTPVAVAETPKPAFKLGLRPAAAAQPAAPAAAPASAAGPTAPPATESPTLNAPPPPKPVETDRGGKGEPAEITAIRKVSGMPFPPPPGASAGKFPPPPGQKKSLTTPAQPGSRPPVPKAKGSKKKLLIMAGAGIFVLALAGGGFVAWQKFTEEPPLPPPKPKAVAKPAVPQAQAEAQTAVVEEQTKEPGVATASEGPKPETAGASAQPKTAEPVVAAVVEAKPVELPKPVAPPPPPPSVAFRGWVENLKISGVRGGANTRVFVGKGSYQPGDLINPQLSIIFESYNAETRVLTFKDKTGAKVERRN